MLEELKHAFQSAGGDDSVDVVVLTGEGRAFCAGLDLKELGSREIAGGQVGDVLNNAARDVISLIESIPKVVIGRINGACITGGLEIVVACDLIVVAEEAKLGDTHAKWGLRPSWGLSQRLPRAVGMANARELSLTARLFTGAEAFAMGLAIRCAPLNELDAVVHSRRIKTYTERHSPRLFTKVSITNSVQTTRLMMPMSGFLHLRRNSPRKKTLLSIRMAHCFARTTSMRLGPAWFTAFLNATWNSSALSQRADGTPMLVPNSAN